MRKLVLPFLIVAGTVGAGLAWRKATEGSRRYAELLDLVRAHGARDGGRWSEPDAVRLWEQLAWFHNRDAAGFTRRLLESLEGGEDAGPAARLAQGMIESERAKDVPRAVRVGDLLPDHRVPEGRGFDPGPFRLPESILGRPDLVDALADRPDPSGHRALIKVVWRLEEPPPHVWPAVGRILRRDGDQELRRAAFHEVVLHHGSLPALRPFLAPLVGDDDPVIRQLALAHLALRGDAPSAREVLLTVVQSPKSVPAEGPMLVLMRLLAGLGPQRSADLARWCRDRRGMDEVWEFSEQLGNVLERRAIGEPDRLVWPD